MFLLNSCLSLFSAACSRRHPFSRSYGVILPNSLTMLLPSHFRILSSPHPPVSVYGTGTHYTIAAFLGTWLTRFTTLFRSTSRLRIIQRICLSYTYPACTGISIPTCAFHMRPYSSDNAWYRNLNLLSIAYVLRPVLETSTYPEQISFTLETLDIRPKGFPPFSRYSFRHSLFLSLHCSFRYSFVGFKNAPLPLALRVHGFGVVFQPRTFSAQELSTSELLRALFECVAASEPTS